MSGEFNYNRRRFLGTAALTLAASRTCTGRIFHRKTIQYETI